MRKEAVSGTILSMKYQAILLSRQNRILPVSDSVFSEGKEENADIAEDAPAAEGPAPVPAPTLEIVQE